MSSEKINDILSIFHLSTVLLLRNLQLIIGMLLYINIGTIMASVVSLQMQLRSIMMILVST